MVIDVTQIAKSMQLKGYKSYLAGFLSLGWAAAGLYLGLVTPGEAVTYATAGLGLIGIRQKLNDLSLPQNVLEKVG